jgi:hypothetical protein
MRLSANLYGANPPAVTCRHAVPDDVATIIIVVRISVVVGIGRKPNSDKRTPVKPVMKTVMKAVEATVERDAVEATSVEAAVKSPP